MFFKVRKDGGPDSNVTGYWLIEWKRVFSIALLRFSDGVRDAYHSHAFNAVSWLLSGQLEEERVWPMMRADGLVSDYFNLIETKVFNPGLKPIVTTRDNLHRVRSNGVSWALTFRGPWAKTWKEKFDDGREVTLTDGRRILKDN